MTNQQNDWSSIACKVSELAAAFNSRARGVASFKTFHTDGVSYEDISTLDSSNSISIYIPLLRKLLAGNSGVVMATMGQFVHPSSSEIQRFWISFYNEFLPVDTVNSSKQFTDLLQQRSLSIGSKVYSRFSDAILLATDSLELESRKALNSDNPNQLLWPILYDFTDAKRDTTYLKVFKANVTASFSSSKELLTAMSDTQIEDLPDEERKRKRGEFWLKAISDVFGATSVLAIPSWLPPKPDGVPTGAMILYLNDRFEWKQYSGIVSAYRAGSLSYLGLSENEKIENLRRSREILESVAPDLDRLFDSTMELGRLSFSLQRKLTPSLSGYLKLDSSHQTHLLFRDRKRVLYGFQKEVFELRDGEHQKNYKWDLSSGKTSMEPGCFETCHENALAEVPILQADGEVKENEKATRWSQYQKMLRIAGKEWNERWMIDLADVPDNPQACFDFLKQILHRPHYSHYLFESQIAFAMLIGTSIKVTTKRVDSAICAELVLDSNDGVSFPDWISKMAPISRRENGNTFFSCKDDDALQFTKETQSISSEGHRAADFQSALIGFVEDLASGKQGVAVSLSNATLEFCDEGAVLVLSCSGEFKEDVLRLEQHEERGLRSKLKTLCQFFCQEQVGKLISDGLPEPTKKLELLHGFNYLVNGGDTTFYFGFPRRPLEKQSKRAVSNVRSKA